MNLGGYRYNFAGTIDATCGQSSSLRSRFAVVAHEVESPHFGLMLYRVEDAILLAQACDGTLYVGGTMDGDRCKGVLRLFALKGRAGRCGR